jgi:serine/threonine-protein kinase
VSSPTAQQRVGRYVLYAPIARGGMATVHLGRLFGEVGFARTVAIKRLHPQFAADPDFTAMMVDEARLVARIQHQNVVNMLDVVTVDGELFLVMEYVPGESLARLLGKASREGPRVPESIVAAVLCGTLHGLHAAHEAKTETGEPLHIVHRDVSPQNVLVGSDGVARVLDFGVAKAAGRLHSTGGAGIKGKLAYMAPEQLRAGVVDRRTDIFAAGIVLWEALTNTRLFSGDTEGEIVLRTLEATVPPPSSVMPGVSPSLDAVVLRALQREPSKRFSNARQMALALETCVGIASPSQVGAWVEDLAGEELSVRLRKVAEVESQSATRLAPARAVMRSAPVIAAEEPDPTGAKIVVTSITPRSTQQRATRRVLLGGVAILALAGLGMEAFLHGGRAPSASPPASPAAASSSIAASATPIPSAQSVPSETAPAPSVSAPRPALHASPSHSAVTPRPLPASVGSGSKGVTEYVGADGVVHFCRPPDCPR